MSKSKTNSLENLISSIKKELEKTNLKITNSVNISKINSFWNIGKLIQKHLDGNSFKDNYGHNLFIKLSEVLNVGKRTLYRATNFYNSYHDLKSISSFLTWSHLIVLSGIKSDEKRSYYENIAIKEKLDANALFSIIKKNSDLNNSDYSSNLSFIIGSPFTYQLKEINKSILLDLGFHTYTDIFKDNISSYNIDSILQTKKTKNNFTFFEVNYKPDILFTYKAIPVKIIDGDTISVDIDLGFKMFSRQTLRLRGINAPSIDTDDGKKAKSFVENKFKNLDFIVIKTYQRDKYDRYITDVFYHKSNDLDYIVTSGNYLNQELLDNKLAVKYYYLY